jgi:acyl-CoA thioester hydrolase
MPKTDYQFFFPFRVRYAETDAQGIVFNGNYLTYTDTAIYEYFRSLSFDFVEYVNQTGADFYTVRVEVDYLSPAHFDDEIHAYVRTSRIGRSSLEFEVGIYHKDTDVEIVRAKVVWVNVDQKSKKPVKLPEDLIHLLS